MSTARRLHLQLNAGHPPAAGIPFHSLNMWVVPAAEIGVGALFIFGFLSRLASLLAIVMMVVATYVHLVVDDPAPFPLQPEALIIPPLPLPFASIFCGSGAGPEALTFALSPADRRQPRRDTTT
ncbi:MAG: DoxX family protein [Acidobacteria bacterium]|nr:DoxX family protein [Acidobacteriota bacterium]